MDALQRLLISEACRLLVLRAATAADGHDADGLAELFTPDGVLQRPGGAALVGRDAIRGAYAARPRSRLTRHLVTNTRVDIDSPAQARAASLILLWAGSLDDAEGAQGRPSSGPALVGEFDDWCVLHDGQWCIERRVARFVLHGPA